MINTRTVITLVALLTTVSLCYSQFGKCLDVPVQQNFAVGKFQGIWYEYARFEAIQERDGYCIQANYTANPSKPGHVFVTNSLRKGSYDGPNATIIGDAYAKDPNEPAKLLVSFPVSPIEANYWIVETDYGSYAMTYSCFNVLGVYHLEYAWILSRTRTLDSTTLSHIYKRFAQVGLDTTKFIQTPQLHCQ